MGEDRIKVDVQSSTPPSISIHHAPSNAESLLPTCPTSAKQEKKIELEHQSCSSLSPPSSPPPSLHSLSSSNSRKYLALNYISLLSGASSLTSLHLSSLFPSQASLLADCPTTPSSPTPISTPTPKLIHVLPKSPVSHPNPTPSPIHFLTAVIAESPIPSHPASPSPLTPSPRPLSPFECFLTPSSSPVPLPAPILLVLPSPASSSPSSSGSYFTQDQSSGTSPDRYILTFRLMPLDTLLFIISTKSQNNDLVIGMD